MYAEVLDSKAKNFAAWPERRRLQGSRHYGQIDFGSNIAMTSPMVAPRLQAGFERSMPSLRPLVLQVTPREVDEMKESFAQAPANLDELKQLLTTASWRRDDRKIANAVEALDDETLLLALPLLLYHKVPPRVLQSKLQALVADGVRDRLQACLLSLLESGLVGFFPGKLSQADVELVVQTLAELYPQRPVSWELAQMALQWLNAAEMVDSLAILTQSGFTSSLVFQFWIARPDAELSSGNLGLFASYREVEGESSQQLYGIEELAALPDDAEFLAECHRYPSAIPVDFADCVDELQLKGVSDQLLISLLSFDQQVALLALGFCSPAVFAENPLDHASPATVFHYWRPLSQRASEDNLFNFNLDWVVSNAFKAASPEEMPAFEEQLISDAQDLAAAGVRFDAMRILMRNLDRLARLNREINTYVDGEQSRSILEAQEQRQRA